MLTRRGASPVLAALPLVSAGSHVVEPADLDSTWPRAREVMPGVAEQYRYHIT